MERLTNVSCIYTGGNIYVYSALFNGEVWISTDFDLAGSYDVPASEIEEKYDLDYDGHWKLASIPYPTWGEILQSVRDNCDESTAYDVERTLEYYETKLTDRILDERSGAAVPTQDDNRERLETISLFVEAFEDFLDEKGIVIPNDEKDDDPDASNIYGTDYGNLSSRIESLLIDFGVLK